MRGDRREAAFGGQAELMVGVAGFGHVEEVDGAVLEALIDGQDRQAAAGAVQEREERLLRPVGRCCTTGCILSASATRFPITPSSSTATRMDVELMASPPAPAYGSPIKRE